MFCNLQGKKALITGGGSGIGKGIAELFIRNEAEVVITGSNLGKLETASKELGDNCSYLQCDMSKRELVTKFLEEQSEVLRSVDILICNAGITRDNLFVRMTQDDFDQVMEVNFRSNFLLMQKVAKFLMRKSYGRIIAISSVVTSGGNFGQANYVASKLALEGVIKTISLELAKRITANAIAPGFIETDMTGKLTEDVREKVKSKIPCGKFGKIEDIAYACLFLASEEASYINGHILRVDGGLR